ncbi:potassium channel family protein [Streptomyces sp. NPDC046985]|uniref:potassium channel family protein n=1 Tax=Streptomyces sp. NPDC046985 TaxID=3155377 RepID=UPI0033E9311E
MTDSAPRRPPQERPPRGRADREGRRRLSARGQAVVSIGRSACLTAALVAVYYLLPLDARATARTSVVLGADLAAVAALFTWQAAATARSPHPRLKAVEVLATTLPLFLLLFAGAYYLLERTSPGSFNEPLTRTDALYFTLSTFATVGYGDIAPRSQTGRVVAMIQMAGGLLLVGVAARILTGAVQRGLRRRPDPPTG